MMAYNPERPSARETRKNKELTQNGGVGRESSASAGVEEVLAGCFSRSPIKLQTNLKQTNEMSKENMCEQVWTSLKDKWLRCLDVFVSTTLRLLDKFAEKTLDFL